MINIAVKSISFLSCCFLLALNSAIAAPTYSGNASCKSCHKGQTASWETSVHAKAFNVLRPGKRKGAKKRGGLDPDKDYTLDKKCLQCHTTGYQQEGGFSDIEATPELVGIGCESCHGPGSEYKVLHNDNPSFSKEQAKDMGQLYGSENADVCKACHEHEDNVFTEKIDKKYKFSWQEALKKRESYHVKAKSQFSFGF